MSFTKKYIKPGVKLYDNQVENVKKLVCRRRALLSDKVGSGKTLSTLYSYAYLKEYNKLGNALILTPLSAYAKKVWPTDVGKFTTLKVIDLDTLAKRLDGHYDKLLSQLRLWILKCVYLIYN